MFYCQNYSLSFSSYFSVTEYRIKYKGINKNVPVKFEGEKKGPNKSIANVKG
jgi:hypothetical protein